jgi:hypothetical protein
VKHTPYWHPRYPHLVGDGERYVPMERRTAAGMIRDGLRDGTLECKKTAHGMNVYVIHTGRDRYHESGRIVMARASLASLT